MRKVLMTGASGGVAGMIRPLLRAIYPDLVLSDLTAPTDLQPGETFIPADLSDPAAVDRAVRGVEGVIHLGGHSVEGPWDTILRSNIVGCYNLFEAARKANVARVVFASSNHAVGFYKRTQRIPPAVTARPDSRYGVSKVFGEAVGALYADKYGMRVTCLRIGNVGERPLDVRRLSIWLRPDDLVQLIRIGLEHPDVRFEVLYGCSDNERSWWDNARAYQLGYKPRGKAEDHAEHAFAEQKKLPADPVGDVFQGGTFCSAEFTGDAATAGPDKPGS